MKPIEEVTCCILDAGAFLPLADMMGKRVKKAYYYTPFESEFLSLERCCIGDGMEHFERVDEYMEPKFFNSVDLWCVPDIGFSGFQHYLRSLGKPVWGSQGASDLELYRTRFLKVLDEIGLPMVGSVVCRGLTELSEHLKQVKDKWVKINRYRENTETFHHSDYEHTQRKLENLAAMFGPAKELVVFVVQDSIKEEEDSPVVEVGYDGWLVTSDDGKPMFPPSTFFGFEAKDAAYLGSLREYDELPEEVRLVNEKFGAVLAEYGYRNFFATEIRIKDGTPFFIDPTCRTAGMTQEHLVETCTNLAEVIWSGANGEIVDPKFSHPFAAEATIHYTDDAEGWKTLRVPPEIADKVKLYRCYHDDGAYHFPPHKSDELGVIIGQGDTIEESIEDLKDAFKELGDEPVSIDMEAFAELLEEIQTSESEGVEFSAQSVPEPEVAVRES